MLHEGECCNLANGGDECELSGPICDSDGQTLRNRCFFDFKKCNFERIQSKLIEIVHLG